MRALKRPLPEPVDARAPTRRIARKHRDRRPGGWPALLTTRRLAVGEVFYWVAPARDVKAGYDVSSENLGPDYAHARARARLLNLRLAAFRRGDLEIEDVVPEKATPGTLAWMFEKYYETDAFARLRPRSKETYRSLIRRTLRIKSKEGKPLGDYRIRAMTPLAADRVYQRLLAGPRGEAVRVANFSISVIKRAWRVVGRQYRKYFPDLNPWAELEMRRKYKPKRAASREQAYCLAASLGDLGHPHLSLVPLVCYEWHQRPENVLSGALKWSDWRPTERPRHVRIEHAKTSEEVWLPLEVEGVLMFPELEAFIQRLPRLGEAMVMTPGDRGKPHLYSFDYANRRMREARAAAGLPDHVTFDACRHGGMTELGDADVTEQGIMALSGHHTPDSARRYVKWTEEQRVNSLRKRRQALARLQARTDDER